MMHVDSKKTKSNTRRHRAQTKRRRYMRNCTVRNGRNTGRNGGMYRVLSATGRMVGRVMGKGPDRADKIKDIANAIKEGVTHSQTPEKFRHVALARQFSASPSSPFRMVSETPRKSHHDYTNVNDEFKTPNKASDSNITPPKLGTRVRHRETTEDRRRRLGFIVATRADNTASVVGELFPEEQ